MGLELKFRKQTSSIIIALETSGVSCMTFRKRDRPLWSFFPYSRTLKGNVKTPEVGKMPAQECLPLKTPIWSPAQSGSGQYRESVSARVTLAERRAHLLKLD